VTVTYRSTRLLVEAINQEMDAVRKAAMGNMALGSLNDLRDFVAQLVKKAERIALEDLSSMADSDPAEYVAAMMPFVAEYHRQLAPRDLLAPCLCRDLRANACVVILMGDQGPHVRAAYDPNRPDAALIVETILATLDAGTKQVAAEAAAVQEQVGIDRQASEPLQYEMETLAQSVMSAWEVYRCDQADPDRACGIRCVGPSDPYERNFIVHDTNREECCHGMRIVDAEYIVELHNAEAHRVGDDV